MMKRIYGLLIAITLTHTAFCQDYFDQFKQHVEAMDTTKARLVLAEWETAEPENAELFTAYLNYHYMKSVKEVVEVTTEAPDSQHLTVTDSLDQVQAYMGSRIYHDEEELLKGYEQIDKGINLYPNRLDMRLGKIYIMGVSENWEAFASEIKKTVEYSVENNNKWTWTFNEPRLGGEHALLRAVQDYQVQLFNTGDDALLPYMRDIANTVLTHYPKHVESLSNLSISYLLTGEYDKGIKFLLKAEEIAPEDYVVLSNIAHAYKMKGDKEKAIAYYQKTAKYGDADYKAFAEEQIEELRK